MSSGEKVTYFAQTDARGKRVPFGIKEKDRSRHMYIIGKTGMGKSTLLENMAIQDIQSGNGLAFIDPHGKSAELLLDYIPKERVNDVLYFAPFDMDFPVAFNIMEDVGADRRHLVANGLMSTFEKIWVDAWSARMAYILNNTLLALLETPGTTLLGINRVLADKEYRKGIVGNIKDPSVRSFWVEEFAKYTERYAAEATPAIQNKVGQFTSNPLIRNIIGQEKSSFDMRQMMDARKIIIVNLSKGLVGEGNAKLLGSMLVTKMYLAAMSRADVPEPSASKLAPCYLYVDEFQSFANKSFADILSEARKYKLALTIAHQYIEQMEEEVAAAVFGNIGTMVTFRVGARDAEFIEKEFAPQFMAEDLVNLGFVQIYLKLMIDGISSPPFSATTLPPIPRGKESFKAEVIAASRRQFAAPRAAVEEKIKIWHMPTPVPSKNPSTRLPIGGQAPPLPSVPSGLLPLSKGETQRGSSHGEGDGFSPREPRPPQAGRGTGYWQERKRSFQQQPRPSAPPPPLRPSQQPISLQSLERKNTPPTSGFAPREKVGQGSGTSALRDALKEVLASASSTPDVETPKTSGVTPPPAPEEVERVLRDGLPPEPKMK